MSATSAAGPSGSGSASGSGRSDRGPASDQAASAADPTASSSSSSQKAPAGQGATSAGSRLWSSWVSPSTAAQTAASSQFEERRRQRRRPSFEEFRAQEPPQARLIRLRGLFDVLLDKDDEQALAGGRAKQEWTRSATRARYGAGGIYARGSMAPKGSEDGEIGEASAGKSSSSSTSSKSSSSSSSSSSSPSGRFSSDSATSTSSSSSASSAQPIIPSTKSSQGHTLSPPRQSYAKELLNQCRECRAQLEKERQELERLERQCAKGGASQHEDSSSGPSDGSGATSSSWMSWIPFIGEDDKAEGKDSVDQPLTTSIKDTLSGLSSGSTSSSKVESASETSTLNTLTSKLAYFIPSKGSNDSINEIDADRPSQAQLAELHSDHEGEAGWIGSGVWGLSAVGHKQRRADRELDAQLASRGNKTLEDLHAETDEGRRQRQRQIEWEGFLRYAEQKERELYKIFTELDKNSDMRLDIAEINTALDRAGIELSQAALEDFIASLSSSSRHRASDFPSSVTFPQFRDYLLLLPRKPSVNEIFRFYQVRKAFGLFGSQGIFGEFSDRWGRSERHGATTVTQDGDVSLAGEERKKPSDDEKEAKREARRVVKEAQISDTTQSDDDLSSAASKTGAAGTAAIVGSMSSGDEKSGSADQSAKSPQEKHDQAKHEAEEEEEEEDSDMIHGDVAVKFLLAGGIAGAVSRTATAPFDRLKIYLITSAHSTAISEVASQPTIAGAPVQSATKLASRGFGMLGEAIRALYHEGGGLKAFWVGNGLNCLKIFPESAIKFLSYETSKRAFAKYVDGVSDSRDISGSSRFISGGIGGITSQFAIYPVETLKTRLMASQGGKSQGNELLFKTARDMWTQGRLKAYYRGLGAGLIGVFPYSAIDMSAFEGIKLFYIKYTGREEPGVLALLAFGSISGSVGATTVYPLSLVRTRLQASGTPAHPQTYDGFFDVARKTFQSEGVVGFYRGLVPSLAKVVPAVSISYVVYEHSKRHLGVQ